MDFSSIKQYLNTHSRTIGWGIIALLVAFLIFHAGVVAGSHGMRPQAEGPGHGFRPPFGAPPGFTLPDGYMPREHGAVGTITAVTLPTITVTEPNGDTETVFIATSTRIEAPGVSPDANATSALVAGTKVIIFGDPDASLERINAKVIHVTP